METKEKIYLYEINFNNIFDENIYDLKRKINDEFIKPLKGEEEKIRYILNGCNNVNLWGAGFVLAVSNYALSSNNTYSKVDLPKTSFHQWFNGDNSKSFMNEKLDVGNIQFVKVNDTTFIVNMITQNGVYSPIKNPVPISYEGIDSCLKKLALYLEDKKDNSIVLSPKVGSGLARGNWTKIRYSYLENLTKNKIKTFIIDPNVEDNKRFIA